MLIGGILVGLLLGLAVGGSIWNLGTVRLERVALLFGAVVVRFATEAAIAAGVPFVDALRLPLFGLAYAMLVAGLWWNRSQPGLSLALVGIVGNALAITINGGHMPIWLPSLEAAGLRPEDIRSVFHTILPADLDAGFLLSAGPLGDVIPIPFPIVRNVASIGDVFLSLGLAFFLFATVVRSPQELDEEEMETVRRRLVGLAGTVRMPAGRPGVRGETGLTAGLAEAAVLERPRVLGASGAGLAAPALAPLPELDARGGEAALDATTVRPAPDIVDRARRHPYVRLALNPSFSALWAGQLISLFGDRIHQIALTFLVYDSTNSTLLTAAVFFSATLPNLLVNPIAVTFVDRWDHREVMIVSDLARAAVILIVPIAAVINIALVYPLVFLVTTL